MSAPSVVEWPSVVSLREQFASQVARTAEQRRAECDCPTEEVYAEVRAAAANAAQQIATALLEAGEMGLDLWAATR